MESKKIPSQIPDSNAYRNQVQEKSGTKVFVVFFLSLYCTYCSAYGNFLCFSFREWALQNKGYKRYI